MPSISMFYGIIIYMYFLDNKQHHVPHFHAKYQDDKVVISIPNGKVLEGEISLSKLKLLQAWIELHANWQLLISGQQPYKIKPLR